MGVWRKQQLPPRIGLGRPETGLVLPGGGARAAYQVGVLKAISRLLREDAFRQGMLRAKDRGAMADLIRNAPDRAEVK